MALPVAQFIDERKPSVEAVAIGPPPFLTVPATVVLVVPG